MDYKMNYVIFGDSKAFKNGIYNLEDVKMKYIYTDFIPAYIVAVKTPTGKVLQVGLGITAKNEDSALKLYDKMGFK